MAVVESTGDGKIVDVLVQDGRHLRFLDGADAALGVEDEDGDILLAAQAVDGSRSGVTTGSADNSQVMSVCATC